MCLYTSADAHLIVDVNGYSVPGTSVRSTVPARLLDTRAGATTIDGVFSASGVVPAGATLELGVAGRGGVASDASAVVLNVTVTEAAASGFLTVFPCGEGRPNSSNLNFEAGATVPNAVIAKVGVNGGVCFFANATTHLVVDVSGFQT